MVILSVTEGAKRTFDPELIHRRVEKVIADGNGSQTALIYRKTLHEPEKRMSYDELNEGANRVARFLLTVSKSRKQKPNADNDWIIGICMAPSNKLVMMVLAILKTGAAYMPVCQEWPGNRIQDIIDESRPALFLYDDECPICTGNVFGNTVRLSVQECLSGSVIFAKENLSPSEMFVPDNDNRPASIAYTSGSTGQPKGVRVTHAMGMNHMNWQLEALPFAPDEKTGIFKSDISFLDSFREIFLPLFNGRQVLIVPKSAVKDIECFVAILEEYKIRRLIAFPSLLKAMLAYLKSDKRKQRLRDLALLMSTSETLTPELAVEYFEYFDEKTHMLINMYGTSETMTDVMYYLIEGKAHARGLEKVPIGYPIFNTAIYALDDSMCPVPRGKQGQLYVTGKHVAPGYVRGRDSHRFLSNTCSDDVRYDRMYATGDYIIMNKDDTVQYMGRADSQIKVRGHRINLSEIEMNALKIPGVLQAIVLAYHTDKPDQAVICFISVDSAYKAELTSTTVRAKLRKLLADYMIPDNIVILDKVPLTGSGKTDRQSLLLLFESQKAKNVLSYYNYSGVSEADMPKARALFQTIAEITHFAAKCISLESNFYDIGGNSLNTILAVTTLKALNFSVNLGDFIRASSLKEILARMTPGSVDGSDPPIAEQINLDMRIEPLKPADRAEAILVLCRSFHTNSELDAHLTGSEVTLDDYIQTIDSQWKVLENSGLSFVAKDKNGRVVGVSINYDVHNIPAFKFHGGFECIAALVSKLEDPIIGTYPKDKKVLLTFMMGTHLDLSGPENVAAMTFMEEEIQKMAKKKGYEGILTTNISEMTRQLMAYQGYSVVGTLQANKFAYKGTKPYAKAPDDYFVTTEYKVV